MSKKPSKTKSPPKKTKDAALIGVGLDNDDGHKRITSSEQFAIVGGSAETHARMTETAVKALEELRARGKHLAQVALPELAEILHKVTPH